jgi:hypothetical protein
MLDGMARQNQFAQVECALTHQQIADILNARGIPMTAKVAWHVEHQALRKLATDPEIQRLAEEIGLAVPSLPHSGT